MSYALSTRTAFHALRKKIFVVNVFVVICFLYRAKSFKTSLKNCLFNATFWIHLTEIFKNICSPMKRKLLNPYTHACVKKTVAGDILGLFWYFWFSFYIIFFAMFFKWMRVNTCHFSKKKKAVIEYPAGNDMFKVGVVLVSLLLTLNVFHTSF